MTNFILAGGNDRTTDGYGVRLAETLKSLGVGNRILSCLFSQAPADRHARFLEMQKWFEETLEPDVSVEEAREETFYEQLKMVDILYLHGGETLRLIDALPDFKKFAESIEGKTVIGSSAGANYLSTTFYSPSAKKIRQGTGVAGVATVVHFGALDKLSHEEWMSVADEVKSVDGKSVHLLAEGQFVVIHR